MSDADLIEVKSEVEFEDGDRELVDVNGAEVGVLRVDGEFHAVRNRCLHDCGPIAEGAVGKKLVGEFVEPGKRVEKDYDDDEPIISCPWHGWSYDLETGEQLADDDIVLPTYDVVVEDGVVYVDGSSS
ncbi:Rieske (2Fe-2S) iron-sulfur domain-containing protein [Haloterrigena salina JCM 13891]|uniref:Rieske (2Fe-2S) iron-sulfur domain-containing protein n=1 Tax=Haloterrigena salina JCM 13891 TaxID=1227488 RepID=M0CMY1_9EURY|nr:Rieske 2Fe-2S domain-containing protein [Haloterrigena salina]ELZ24615.1 Rieske (2Fe-2S) iron-sulfur domain-containing protein [Haloterrigena salina JCM 13891]